MNSATAKEENGYIIWTFPQQPNSNPKKNPVRHWLDLYTIDELEKDIETGEKNLGERNNWIRHLLNDALQERGSEPVF